jgi:hypothetical protein
LLLADVVPYDHQVSGVAFVRQACSHNRHGNVTICLRGRHLFVTPGCNGHSKPPNKTMKLRQSLIDSLKRAAATVMDAAMFAGPTNYTFQFTKLKAVKSEHGVNGLVDAFAE